MNKFNFKRFLQIVITIALIAYVCYSAGFFSEEGRIQFASTLKDVNWVFIWLSLFVSLVQNLISIRKWQIVVIAKKSWRTRKLVSPTTSPRIPATKAAIGIVNTNGTDAFINNAEV